ncbi:hypothetical protein AAFF_G00038350, partial [Aldrovandia affinis]
AAVALQSAGDTFNKQSVRPRVVSAGLNCSVSTHIRFQGNCSFFGGGGGKRTTVPPKRSLLAHLKLSQRRRKKKIRGVPCRRISLASRDAEYFSTERRDASEQGLYVKSGEQDEEETRPPTPSSQLPADNPNIHRHGAHTETRGESHCPCACTAGITPPPHTPSCTHRTHH